MTRAIHTERTEQQLAKLADTDPATKSGKLPSNATIKTVWDSRLQSPQKWLTEVLSHMEECRSRYGNAHVRIGVTGLGITPFHKVTFRDASGEPTYGAWDRTAPFDPLRSPDWSTESMSLDEVRDFQKQQQPRPPGEG
jgi:hypothetical protein